MRSAPNSQLYTTLVQQKMGGDINIQYKLLDLTFCYLYKNLMIY